MATLTTRQEVADPNAMSLVEHLGELRHRLVVSLGAFAGAVVIAYLLYGHILRILERPYCELRPHHCALVVLAPLDAFGIHLDIAGYGGLLLASPVLMWQLWRFVTPGLRANERRYAVPFVASSVVLFFLGAYVAWLTFPHTLGFFKAVGGSGITTFYTAQKYLSLAMLLMAALGAAFEFPVVLVALELAGVVTPAGLARVRRWAIICITVVAAVATPSSDPFSMLAMAAPMVIFYEAAIIVSRLVRR